MPSPMSFFDAIAESDPVAHYVSAFKAADHYVATIEGVSAPPSGSSWNGNAKAVALLLQLKGTVGAWVNNAGPHCQEVPADIVAWDPGLQTLITELEGFAQHPITPSVATQIVNTTKGILTILKPPSAIIKQLITTLDGLNSGLATDFSDLRSLDETLQQTASALTRELAMLHGQLASVERAHCPSSSEIQKLEKEIGQANRERDAVIAWLQALAPVMSAITNAAPAVQYLTSSWQAFGQELKLVIQVASAIQRAPAKLTTFETIHLSTSWSAVKQQMAAINAQLG